MRYVATGDSSTEGLHYPDGSGGFRGRADRLAGYLAEHQGGRDPLPPPEPAARIEVVRADLGWAHQHALPAPRQST